MPALGAVAAIVALSAGCGGDDDAGSGDGGADDAAAEDAAAEDAAPNDDGSEDAGAEDAVTVATGDGADANAAGDGTPGFDCPVSAEQASEILGVEMEKNEETCFYSPVGASLPAAGFFGQLPELCEGDFVTQSGYTEPVDGLGADAFLKTGGGATVEIWVCAADPFVVFVDTGGSDTGPATDFAKALAVAAIAGS
jgi:hypothetical protein